MSEYILTITPSPSTPEEGAAVAASLRDWWLTKMNCICAMYAAVKQMEPGVWQQVDVAELGKKMDNEGVVSCQNCYSKLDRWCSELVSAGKSSSCGGLGLPYLHQLVKWSRLQPDMLFRLEQYKSEWDGWRSDRNEFQNGRLLTFSRAYYSDEEMGAPEAWHWSTPQIQGDKDQFQDSDEDADEEADEEAKAGDAIAASSTIAQS
jgi:hypothetical protein